MHPRQDFHFVRVEENNVFVKFMIVRGCLKVMPSSPLIQMVLVILEMIRLKKRGMRNSNLRVLIQLLIDTNQLHVQPMVSQ